MQVSDYVPPHQTISRPTCRDCGVVMWLARIEPHEPHHDKRTFQCPDCNSVIDEIVKYR